MSCELTATPATQIIQQYGCPSILSQAHFHPALVENSFNNPETMELRECDIGDILGKIISKSEVGRLIGNLNGTRIHSIGVECNSEGDCTAYVLYLTNPLFDGYMTIKIKDEELVIDELFLHDEAPRYTGTRMLAYMVKQAHALGFTEISLVAHDTRRDNKSPTGKKRLNGYYTWPRLGFNAPLPPEVKAVFPGCEDFLQLMTTQAGRDWWKEKGKKTKMNFSLNKNSNNRRTLANYLIEKSIHLD